MTNDSPAYSRDEGKARRQRLAEAEAQIMRERDKADAAKELAKAEKRRKR